MARYAIALSALCLMPSAAFAANCSGPVALSGSPQMKNNSGTGEIVVCGTETTPSWDLGLSLVGSGGTASVGIGTTRPNYPLEVNGDMRADGWLRTSGSTGWYNDTYGGGWYMSDGTWIRSYGGKPMYEANGLDTGAASGINCGGGLGGSYTLHVCGTAGLDSTLYVGSGQVATNGDSYLAWAGVWQSSWLNQSVTNGANPTFGNIYLNYGPGWISNWLNQSVANGSSPTFNTIYSNGPIHSGGIVGRQGINGTWNGNTFNFWWDGSCIHIWVDVTDFQISCPSDERVKKDILALPGENGINAIMRLKPVSFHWRGKRTSTRLQFGLIAQDVRRVFPNLVINTGMKTKYTPNGLLRLDYNGLFGPVIKAVQELKSLFDDDHAEIEKLKSTNADQAKAIDSLHALVEKQGREFEAYKTNHP